MSPRFLFLSYVALSVVDFAATVYLVTNGYADEANPLIRGFTAQFHSFPLGLAIYKLAFLTMVTLMLRSVHQHSANASRRLLVFANTVMLCLASWHAVCIGLNV